MQHVSLTELADLNPPVDTSSLDSETPVTFLGMADVSEDGDILQRQRRQYREVKYGYTAFQEDDVLVAKITPCLENGKGCHATDLKNGVGFGSTEFHVLRAKSGVSPRYLYYWTQFADFRHAAEASMIGSAGQQRVQPYFYDEFDVPAFDLDEQRRIARVLDAVDAAIRRTDRVVGKLDHVRQGLLHDLLTRGLTPDGRLRDPDAHPDQFRDSPLGRIPDSYELVPLGDLIVDGPRNGLYKPKSEYQEDGTRIVRIDSFYGGVIRSQDSLKRVRLTDQDLRRYQLSEGDILLNRVNSIDYLGKSAYVPKLQEPTVFESNMMRFRVDESFSLPKYVGMQLGSPLVQRQIRRRAKHAVAQASVNQNDVRSLLFPLPSQDEQQRVLQRYEAHEQRENAEDRRTQKLQNLKRGLMRDLLTGDVRITDDVERRVADATGRPVS